MPHPLSRLEVRRDRRPDDVELLRGSKIHGELGAEAVPVASRRRSSSAPFRCDREADDNLVRTGRRTRGGRSCVIVRFGE